MRARLRKHTLSADMTEYVIVVALLLTCSVAMYFSMLLTGAKALGHTICNDCPQKEAGAVDPWDRPNEDPGDKEGEGEDQNQDQNQNQKDDEDKADIGDDDSLGDMGNDININGEFYDFLWNNWFSWGWW